MPDKTLVIAEKPSAAGDIARALGVGRAGDHYENDSYVVSSAVGHLLEMIPPEGAEVKRGKWSLANLPVLPRRFDLQPIKNNEARLRQLKKLYARGDVSRVINACDAGREGELIFLNLMRYLGEKKPARRLWLQSMTPAAIRRGFDSLRENADMLPLQQAAVCRAEADWLVGINGTRAITALNSAGGGFFLTTVGRVQTPTLAMIVEREEQIRAFVSRPYWEARAVFAIAAGEYEGLWRAPAAARDKKAEGKDEKPERIFDKKLAEQIVADCQPGGKGEVSETVKPASEAPPMLFDLTSLQREANGRFGFSARATLATAQALYERHKLITYPRTDSRALPQDYPAVVNKTLAQLAKDPDIGRFAARVLEKKWVAPANRRIFNNAKVSDHFAIIPTGEAPRPSLREPERKLYDFIRRRFVAAFYPPAKFLLTERQTRLAGHCFVSKGKVMQEAGWREVAAAGGKDTTLPALAAGEAATLKSVEAQEKQTLPPARYTEATLLSAMEGAGKLVDDEELREAMRERGLGTPATRAAIIEGLLREKYLTRDRRDLIPTPKAHSLARLLSALKISDLTKPELTGEWEMKLRQIERRAATDKDFMAGIAALADGIVKAAKNFGDTENIPGNYAALAAPCPACGGKVVESHRKFSCEKCEFSFWKALGGRELALEEAEALLANGETGELTGFRSRLGREFAANVKLQKNEAGALVVAFNFGPQETELSNMSPDDISAKDEVGSCPKCGGKTRDIGNKYICEKAVGDSAACDFSIARRILQQEVAPEQIRLLLSEGKTAFLERFVSKKTGRPFKARLTMNLQDKQAKLGFEFAPRADKGRAAKPAGKPARRRAG
jgi:DNA topoisomerase-3